MCQSGTCSRIKMENQFSSNGVSKQRQVELWYAAQSGDINARNQLIESILRFIAQRVVLFVKRIDKRAAEYADDLINDCTTQVISAFDSWNPEKGTAFHTFMGQVVDNHLMRTAPKIVNRGIYVPISTIMQLKKVDLESDDITAYNKQRLKSARSSIKQAFLSDLPNHVVSNVTSDAVKSEQELVIEERRRNRRLYVYIYRRTTPEQRKAIIWHKGLFNSDKLSYEEIASRLNKTVAQVKMIYRVGIDRLNRRQKCAKCNKPFIVQDNPILLSDDTGKLINHMFYCSVDCRDQALRKHELRKQRSLNREYAYDENGIKQLVVIVKCICCKNPFKRFERDRTPKLCSDECKAKYSALAERKCQNCDRVMNSLDVDRKFCNRDCFDEFVKKENQKIWEDRRCPICNNILPRKDSKFCSVKCVSTDRSNKRLERKRRQVKVLYV